VTPIRVLLADDQQSVRQGLEVLIDAQPDMAGVCDARRVPISHRTRRLRRIP